MNEESIFAAALQKKNSAERAAHLSEACGTDRALLERVFAGSATIKGGAAESIGKRSPTGD
jgi:hypothetical protein